MIPESYLGIHEFHGQGYLPLVDYASWRVAVLRYIDELRPQKIEKMQKHTETDEVFVLLHGRCILFIGEGEHRIHTIYAQDMAPLKLYNVRRNSWHSHTLSEDATVLIVENRNTHPGNSPEIALNREQKLQLAALTATAWQGSEAQ